MFARFRPATLQVCQQVSVWGWDMHFRGFMRQADLDGAWCYRNEPQTLETNSRNSYGDHGWLERMGKSISPSHLCLAK